MCRVQSKTLNNNASSSKRQLLLTSIDSYKGHNGNSLPSYMSMFVTGLVIIGLLITVELSLRQLFVSIKVRGMGMGGRMIVEGLV